MAAARREVWETLELDNVSGTDAYGMTEPSVDALRQVDESRGLAERIRAISDAEIARHADKWLPTGSKHEDVIGVAADMAAIHDLLGQIIAVPPEALDPGRPELRKRAAGFQLHIRGGDVLVPVCESGLHASQVLHAALTDVAREVNARLTLIIGGRPRREGFCAVSPPHGAVSGFDPHCAAGKGGAAAASTPADHGAAASAGPAADTAKALPDQTWVKEAWHLPVEDARSEVMDFTHSPRFPHKEDQLSVALLRVLGRRSVYRCGAAFADKLAGSSRFSIGLRDEDIGVAMSARSAAASTDQFRRLLAQQRACREYMSSTMYNASYLRDCCLDKRTKDSRVIFFACGRSAGVVARRLREVTGRQHPEGEHSMLHRIVIVLLPTWDFEGRLSVALERAQADRESAGPDSPAMMKVQHEIAGLYVAITRVVRAGVPPHLAGTPGPLVDWPAEVLWSEAMPDSA